MRFTALLLLMFGLVPHASADALDSVRDALRALPGKTPLHATLERRIDIDQKGKTRVQGAATVAVSSGVGGVQLDFPSEQLARAAAEKQDADNENPHSLARALGSLDVTEIAATLNCAAALLHDLDGAKLLKDSSVSLRGAPARLLELELVVHLSKADQKHLSDTTSSMKLWLGADGLPLASEKQTLAKGSFMLISFSANEFQARDFAHRADRLVAVREERRLESAGFGESAKDQRVTSVTLP
jgi:hypothetical protein